MNDLASERTIGLRLIVYHSTLFPLFVVHDLLFWSFISMHHHTNLVCDCVFYVQQKGLKSFPIIYWLTTLLWTTGDNFIITYLLTCWTGSGERVKLFLSLACGLPISCVFRLSFCYILRHNANFLPNMLFNMFVAILLHITYHHTVMLL
jgi:hypothetical protein